MICFQDEYVLHTFEFLYVLFFLREVRNNLAWEKGDEVKTSTQRGEKTIDLIFAMIAAMGSIFLVYVVSDSEAAKGYKSFLHILNFSMLWYLLCKNPYFINRLVGYILNISNRCK
jgi:hypothetical protein